MLLGLLISKTRLYRARTNRAGSLNRKRDKTLRIADSNRRAFIALFTGSADSLFDELVVGGEELHRYSMDQDMLRLERESLRPRPLVDPIERHQRGGSTSWE